MRPVAELLPQIYRKLAKEAADEEALLLALWPVVVGGKIAARTRPVRLYKTTLVVETTAQDWRKELAGMAGDIVARLNAAAGKAVVNDIQFLVAIAASPRPPRRAAAADGAKDEAAEIRDPHMRRLYRISRRRAQTK